MQLDGLIFKLPAVAKRFLIAFVLVLSVGFYTGVSFVSFTTDNSPKGVEENYLGNEEDEEAEVMKFKKSDREMLTTIHTHILSLAFIFFLQGCILLLTTIPHRVKTFLLIEPFVSVLLTFGGLFLMWKGILWMKYIVILSGTLMTTCFTISTAIILYQLFSKKKTE